MRSSFRADVRPSGLVDRDGLPVRLLDTKEKPAQILSNTIIDALFKVYEHLSAGWMFKDI